MENNRPTVEVLLPISKAKVELYASLRHGDFIKLKKLLASAMIVEAKKPEADAVDQKMDVQIKGVNTDVAFDEEDMLVQVLTKAIYLEDGTQVSDIRSFVYNLEIEDGQILYAKAKEIGDTTEHTRAEIKK